MEEEGKWITLNGTHIFVKKGQNPMDAFIKQKGGKWKKPEKYEDTFEYGVDEDNEDDAYDKYVEMSDECYNKLDREDVDLIQEFYVGTDMSYEINEALRDGQADALSQDFLNSMDKACETYVASNNMASTRFVDLNYLRNAYGLDIPEYGDVDRSKIADNMKDFIGTDISSKSYTSVSLNESGNGIFNNLAVKMKINIPKGTKMFVADNVGEYEAILGRNKKMILKDVNFKESKVQGFEKEYGKILLTYEVIEDGKKQS